VEVGQEPNTVKYEVALKLKTLKNGPVIRNRIRLPHPVKSDMRIGVVCKEDSPMAEEARQAGAVTVGEQTVFDQIRAGNILFDRLICHTDSMPALQRSGLGRILGPKGLMPSLKTRTITNNVPVMMRDLVGADNYRERVGVVRLAIGQLGFTPQMIADNIKAFVAQVRREMGQLDDSVSKDIDEIVLSSTHGPGFSLSGGFNPTDDKITPAQLATVM